MTHVLLLDDENDSGTVERLKHTIRDLGYAVLTTASGLEGLRLIERDRGDIVLSDLRCPDAPAARPGLIMPFVVFTGFSDAENNHTNGLTHATAEVHLPHAAARLARAVASVLDAPKDPRTITNWSQLIATSPGALCTWCRTAGLSPRRSLVFARLLRAVSLGSTGHHKPENLLDVVDRRTIGRLLTFAGLPATTFPSSVDDFLRRQTLIRDAETMSEILRVVGRRVS